MKQRPLLFNIGWNAPTKTEIEKMKTNPSDKTTKLILEEKNPLIIAKLNLLVSIGSRTQYMAEIEKETYYNQLNLIADRMRKRNEKTNKIPNKNNK